MRKYLEDKKSVVVKVDSAAFQKRLDFSVGALLAVDGIPTRVVFVRRPSDDELGLGDDFKGIWSGLILVS